MRGAQGEACTRRGGDADVVTYSKRRLVRVRSGLTTRYMEDPFSQTMLVAATTD